MNISAKRAAARVSPSLTAVLTGAILLAGVAPATASATIVLGQSAGGVSLGDTGKQVRATLGAPRSSQKYTGGQSWFFSGYWITLDRHVRVQGIEVKTPAQKTDKGIGVGSSYTRFRKAYTKAKCHSDGGLARVYRICSLSTKVRGNAVNNLFVFSLGSKTLALIDIGNIGEFA